MLGAGKSVIKERRNSMGAGIITNMELEECCDKRDVVEEMGETIGIFTKVKRTYCKTCGKDLNTILTIANGNK